MQDRNRTARRRADHAWARAASVAETRRIRRELAWRTGGDAAPAPSPADRTARTTLRLVAPERQWLVPALPWPEEAPDQHMFARGDVR